MPAIGVILIRGEENRAAIGGERGMFDFEIAGWVEWRGNVAVRGNRIEMEPAGAFPGEDNAIARAPEQLGFGGHGVEYAAWAARSVPEFAAVSRVRVGD